MHRNIPEIDLEQVKVEIKAAAQLLKPGGVSSDAGSSDLRLPADRIPHLRLPFLSFQPEFHSAFQSEFKYSELARYDGREFVRNAYLAILRHGPDPGGQRFYLNMLRRGRSKAEVILRLRLSGEGRAQKVKIRGLIPAAALEGVLRIPLLGYLLRILTDWVLLPRTLRDIRMRQEMLKDHLNEMSERTRDTVNRVIQQQRHANLREHE